MELQFLQFSVARARAAYRAGYVSLADFHMRRALSYANKLKRRDLMPRIFLIRNKLRPMVRAAVAGKAYETKLTEKRAAAIEREGYVAANNGVAWWHNPYSSGSKDAYSWDSGHTRRRRNMRARVAVNDI